MPAQGGEVRRLTNDPAFNAPSSWSPDASQLAVPFSDGIRAGLQVVPAQGGAPQELTDSLAFDDWMPLTYWSADGEWVIFTSNREGRPLWRVPASGGEEEPFLDGRSPVWSADGETVYFVARRNGRVNLYSRDSGTQTEHQLTDFVGKPGFLLSLDDIDGEYLYFTWREDRGDLWVMDVERGT